MILLRSSFSAPSEKCFTYYVLFTVCVPSSSSGLWLGAQFGRCPTYNQLEAGHSIKCITHAGRAAPSRWAASHRNETAPHDCLVVTFCTFWPCDLLNDLILIGGRGTVIDYPCAKFGDLSFNRFGFIVRTDRQNHRCGWSLLTRLPSAWVNMV